MSMNPGIRKSLKILELPQEMRAVEALQRLVWPGSETDVVPLHMLVTAAHNGGLVIGSLIGSRLAEQAGAEIPRIEGTSSCLVGFVFGFPGLYFTPDGPRPKHCSQELGVHPGFRDQGLGFALKRAQWQMVRRQGLDLITWTYDPLQSRNAMLNIHKLGGVCNTYLREVYGEMQDGLNAGLPSDRFQVDWWVNTQRVNRRLSKKARGPLDLAHYLAAEVIIVNSAREGPGDWPRPAERSQMPAPGASMVLVEIPSDIQGMKAAEPGLALEWRLHTRELFEGLFAGGYIVTDFVYLPGSHPRSYYVLSHGEASL